MASALPPPPRVTIDQVIDEACLRDGDDDEERSSQGHRREVEQLALPEACGQHDFGDARYRQQRGVLLEADEVVEQRRDDAAHGLRYEHRAQRLGVTEA